MSRWMGSRARKLCRGALLWSSGLCAMLSAAGAYAEGEPLSAELRVHGGGRVCAPRAATVKLLWNGTSLLEGDLVIRVLNGNSVATRTVVTGLALTPGSQSFGVLLPAGTPQVGGGNAEASLAFRHGRKLIDLERHAFPMPASQNRSLVVAYPIPLTQETRARATAVAVAPDRLYKEDATVYYKGQLRSSICGMRPQDLPNTPEAYCAFDMVVLTGDGVLRIRAPQVEALKTWVRAGGSVLVANLEGLSLAQQELFEELFENTAGFAFDLEGNQVGSRMVVAQYGNGCVAALNDTEVVSDIGSLFKDAGWLGLQSFLWRTRHGQKQHVLSKHQLSVHQESSQAAGSFSLNHNVEQTMKKHDNRRALHLEPMDLMTGQNYLTSLMPNDMEFVQVKWLALVLIVLVIFVGPVDYFLLRRLKLQRFTWLTVPFYVTVATVTIVMLANSAMGRHDRRNRLCLLDTDSAGNAVRQNDIYLVVPSSHGTLTEHESRSLVSPVRVGSGNNYYAEHSPVESSMQISGRYPQDYTMEMSVSQWKPVAWRAMTLQPTAAFPWTLPERQGAFSSRDEVKTYWKEFEKLNRERPVGAYMMYGGRVMRLRNHSWPKQMGTGDQRPELFTRLAQIPPVGYMSLVSRIAPACDSTLEDLALYDVTDHKDAVLVLAWLDGDTICISRTPFRSAPGHWLARSGTSSSIGEIAATDFTW